MKTSPSQSAHRKKTQSHPSKSLSQCNVKSNGTTPSIHTQFETFLREGNFATLHPCLKKEKKMPEKRPYHAAKPSTNIANNQSIFVILSHSTVCLNARNRGIKLLVDRLEKHLHIERQISQAVILVHVGDRSKLLAALCTIRDNP